MYGVYLKESNFTGRVLKTFENKEKAIDYIDFIIEKYITNDNIVVTCQKDSKYGKTVSKERILKGYIYNSRKIDKIFDIDICYIPNGEEDTKVNMLLKIEDSIDKILNREIMNNVIQEIKEKKRV